MKRNVLIMMSQYPSQYPVLVSWNSDDQA